MESPPPAVFHYKYQSYKYERNTAGKSARLTAKLMEENVENIFGTVGTVMKVNLSMD